MAASGQRVQDEARLQKITRELDRLVDAIVEGVPAERVKGRMLALEAEKTTLEARLAGGRTDEKPLLHTRMGDVYRKAVASLREKLETGADRAEAVNLLRSLIDRIVLHPAADEASGFLIDLEGDLAGILSRCSASKKAARVSADGLEQIKLVAGA